MAADDGRCLSVGIQEQPKIGVIFAARNWNRFWNREAEIPGTVGNQLGKKSSLINGRGDRI
jgi:hypothetical protein